MTSKLERWARGERQALREEIGYLNAGGKVFSPSGDNITGMKLKQLSTRVEELDFALKDIDDASRS